MNFTKGRKQKKKTGQTSMNGMSTVYFMEPYVKTTMTE